MATNIPNIYGSNVYAYTTGAVGSTGPTYVITGAGGGGVTTGTYTINIANSCPSSLYDNQITTDYDVVIKRKGKQDLHVAKTLEALMERLSVIEPNYELMEKYPALREGYENYKVMEALLLGGDKEDENE